MSSCGIRPSWIAWRDSEKEPEITACEAMTVAAVDSSTSGNSPHPGTMRKERVLDRGLVAEEQRALSKIIEDEGGQHQREPCEPDREPAEMAHISVKRLAAGDREGHRTKHDEAASAERS